MERKKIAILGGGIAALSAAFELTELDPDHQLFDITIYTIGWRLGGKGAVGRNAAAGYRAEEHGLHVWTGFYDNAFHLVDRVYAAMIEQGERPPFCGREHAFIGLNHCVLMEPVVEKADPYPDPALQDWRSWVISLAPHEGLPGTPRDSFFSLTDFLRSLVKSSAELIKSVEDLVVQWPDDGPPLWTTDAERKSGPFVTAQTRIASLPSDPTAVTRRQSEELQILLQYSIEPVKKVAQSAGGKERIRLILGEIALAIAYGMLRDEVIWNGFDCVDGYEWKEWMHRNGCSEEALNSAIVRGCYDYVFGFIRGQTNVGAGTGTRILLKLMFAYRGSFFYLLRATMGELIFAPLYQVLCHRKVKFNFFTRVDRIGLSADGESIEFIDTTIQARPNESTYYPLIEIPDGKGGVIPSWPSEPVYCRLQDGDQLRGVDLESAWSPWQGVGHERLELDTHFDDVVLGISIGAFGTICEDLINRVPRWKDMTDAVQTTATTAFQAWTTKTSCELGAKVRRTVLSGFQLPFDSWGDLSLMLPMEQWPADNYPKGLAYFVGTLNDDPPPPSSDYGYPDRALAQAETATLDWVNKYLFRLWPNVVDADHRLQWDLFFDPQERCGQKRLEAQYLRVNINPSDRYVLSVTGSVSARMRADESGVDNLYLAGDWVRTGINAGCIEASVMAGRAAAAAITGVSLTMPNSTDFDANDLPTQLIPFLDVARKLGGKAVAGTGEIEAFCVLFSLPTDFVKGKLPNGLALHVPKGQKAPPPEHEVVFIFARQRNVRPGLFPLGGADYFEIAELIPDVVLFDGTHFQTALFSYMPQLLVDSLPATLIGQQFYGFNKQLARITVDGGAFNVRSPIGNLRAGFERVGVPGDISDFGRIKDLRSKLEQPLVGVKKNGTFVYSILNFGLSAAVFQLITGTVNIRPPFVPPQPKDAYDFQLQASTGYPWGFRFLGRWTLSLPFDAPAGKTSDTDKNLSKITADYGRAVLGRFLLPRG